MKSAILLSLLCPLAVYADSNTAWVHATSALPDTASRILSHGFVSFSFPIHFFQDFSGPFKTPNAFSNNLLDVLANKTGVQPSVRLGGTSTDRTTYIAWQQETFKTVSGSNGIPTNVTIGPSFFQLFDNFPQTNFVFDLDLQRNDSGAVPNVNDIATGLIEVLGDRLTALEIGNEPAFYVGVERPANYSIKDYAMEFATRASEVAEVVIGNAAINTAGLPTRLFQAGTLLGPPYVAPGQWTTQQMMEAGIDSNGLVSAVSLHNYPVARGNNQTLQNQLMNNTAIISSLQFAAEAQQYLASNYPDIKMRLGETNSDATNLNQSQISGVFGSALWTVGYLCRAAVINIAQANLHQGTTFGYSAWQPVKVGDVEAQVRAPFYGLVFMADFIGTSPDVQIAPVNITEGDAVHLVAYAAYENRHLAKVALINYNYWDKNSNVSRESSSFSMWAPEGACKAKIEYLCAADGAIADSGITWGGQSWNYTSNGYAYDVKDTTWWMDLGDNKQVNLSLEASSAAMVTFEW